MAALFRLAGVPRQRRRGRWVVALCCAVLPAAAAGEDPYLHELQRRAAELELADSRAWRSLVHYEPGWLGPGVASTVASDWFFRAPDGRTDPAAELAATLAAFFDPAPVAPRDEPAQCVFRARYQFLDRRLGFDRTRMPRVPCDDYEAWLAALDPQRVRLIFPTAFLNSPASMFGHTLLRIDGGDTARRPELLSYAVNFAAETGEEAGVAFAVKGLTGGYPGIYGVYQYYDKVREYAWIENRDVWSYPLALDDAEIARLAAHLWELDEVRFDYYFLTKNCSYQLLALLQAARPSLRLTERFDWYAIPADTIRALAEVSGLLGPPDYRPALATTLRAEAGTLSPAELELALAVATGEAAPDGDRLAALAERDAARVLEVAHDHLYYRRQTGAETAEEAGPRLRSILLARSRIGTGAEFPPAPRPEAAPHAAHPTLRFAAGGVWEDDRFTLRLRLRPAYHDLLDPPGGYTDGAQITFLDLGLRLDPDTGDARLEDLVLLDILSLSPRDAVFRPVSWQVSTGLRRRPLDTVLGDGPDGLGYYIEGGPGLAWGDARGLAGYLFALASADTSSGFDAGYATAAGASAGVLAQPVPGWRIRAELGALNYVAGDAGRRRWGELTQQWALPAVGETMLGLRLTLGWQDAAGEDVPRAALALHAYF